MAIKVSLDLKDLNLKVSSQPLLVLRVWKQMTSPKDKQRTELKRRKTYRLKRDKHCPWRRTRCTRVLVVYLQDSIARSHLECTLRDVYNLGFEKIPPHRCMKILFEKLSQKLVFMYWKWGMTCFYRPLTQSQWDCTCNRNSKWKKILLIKGMGSNSTIPIGLFLKI